MNGRTCAIGDPLRIWLARKRLHQWLTALELARDEEARAAGIDGTDLAEVILASARLRGTANLSIQAALVGEPSALKERIRRLLDPSPVSPRPPLASGSRALLLLVPALMIALAAGTMFGEQLVRALFWIA